MERKIIVNNGVGKYEGKNEQIRVEEDLIIHLEYDCPSDYVLMYVASNGKDNKSGTIKDKTITLPATFVKVGEISLKVEVIVLNEVEETIPVEDLIIRETNSIIETIPEVKVLKEVVEELKDKCDVLIKLVGGLYDLDLGEKL